MKEAIGGSWLYTLVIVLIALFTTFISVTTNYTRSYKIKDHLLQVVEEHGGVTTDTLKDINDYLNSLGYTAVNDCPDKNDDSGENWFGFSRTNSSGPVSGKANYCIYKHVVACRVVDEDKEVATIKGQTGYNTYPRAYYGVAVFFRLDWPILRQVIQLNLSGETSIIYLTNINTEIDKFAKQDSCKNYG